MYMCPCGVTSLSVDVYFTIKMQLTSTKQTLSHRNVTSCYNDIAEKFLTLGIKQQSHPNSDIKHIIEIRLNVIYFLSLVAIGL